MQLFSRQLQHSWKALKQYWSSINRALKTNVLRQHHFNSGPSGFWKESIVPLSLTGSWSTLNESLCPYFYHIFAWSSLIFSCDSVENTSFLIILIITSEAWISHRRSQWEQEELPKTPEGSWWSSSDCHQDISVAHFRVLKFEEPLYSSLFDSFHLPLFSFTSRSLIFEQCLWSS